MKKILVADDSVTIQKVIALTFADEPFEVQSVGTGAEALEMMNSWKPDILLADVIMPQMNGYELCRAVKEQQGTSSVPVLLLAGTFEAFDEEEAKSVGADGYITKPFESGELIEKVNSLVGIETPTEKGAELLPETAQGEKEASGVEPPPVEPPPTPSFQTAKDGQGMKAAPRPAQEADVAEKGQEPDIWDILSDTEGGAADTDGNITDAAVPGLGPIEDRGVVDVGSFDVGLDRPKQVETPPGPQPGNGVELPPEQVDTERSTVEDREKDFFGFETEGPEAAGEDVFPADAVEEITFEVDKPVEGIDNAKQEASFIVPEPAEVEISVTGETIAPEVLAPEPSAPEPPPHEEPPLSLEEPLLQEQNPEEFARTLKEQGVTPGTGEAETRLEAATEGFVPEPSPSAETFDSGGKDIGTTSEETAAESPPEMDTVEPEPAAGLGQPGGFTPAQASESVPGDMIQGATGDEIRKIIEEKVEKIVWEVVPEMAEVLIREALEEIKGKP